MNRHDRNAMKPAGKLVGLTLVAAMTAALGCSSGGSSSPGTGGSTTGTAGTTGKGGSGTGTGGTAGGTGGSVTGTGGSTTGSGGTATGTGGTATGTGGTAGGTGGTGGTAGGTGGTAGGTGGTGTGGSAGGTGGTGTGGSAGGTGGGAGSGPPANLPPTLTAPAGATVKLHLHAIGDQIYTCTASAAGGAGGSGAGGAGGGATTYSFVLKQPDAKLYDQNNAQVATHGAGPNWTSTVDGSVVNGAKVFQENAPTAGAIPWLLLRATSNTGTGVFSDVTYVQRVNTTGGVAPTTGCDSAAAGMDTKVPYTADYYFYSGGGPGTAWLTAPANTPPTLAVPSGATLKIHDHAIGAQVYTCTASAAGGAGGAGAGGAGGGGTTYAWVLKQPDAVLYDSSFASVGTHGLGPNWTSAIDGSVVNGAKVFQENAPAPTTGAIPWLLLRATSNTGTGGAFSDVTYVLRANTAGGVAPTGGCDSTTAGMDTRINYSADYYFYSGGGPGTAWLTPPANLPAAIAVPSGATLKLHDHAIGAQVYTCTAGGAGGTSGTTYAWVLKQPDAVLYDSSFAQVGTHGLGPNWTSTVDGSVVNGAKTAGVNSTTAGAIQWLLLQATSNTGSGAFSDVTWVQRLNTAGGVAPGSGCDSTAVGTDTRIPYSADYYFFTGAGATDGGTGG